MLKIYVNKVLSTEELKPCSSVPFCIPRCGNILLRENLVLETNKRIKFHFCLS